MMSRFSGTGYHDGKRGYGPKDVQCGTYAMMSTSIRFKKEAPVDVTSVSRCALPVLTGRGDSVRMGCVS